jgi:hypothetical protein
LSELHDLVEQRLIDGMRTAGLVTEHLHMGLIKHILGFPFTLDPRKLCFLQIEAGCAT